MPTVTWEDLRDLGFVYVTAAGAWQYPTGSASVVVDVNHNDPHVTVAGNDDRYGATFHGVRSRADVEALIRLLGEPA